MNSKSKKSLKLEAKESLKKMNSMSSTESPGSVYDQYFDAFNDSTILSPNMLPNQVLKLTHGKPSNLGYHITSFDSNYVSDTEESEVYDDTQSLPTRSLNASKDIDDKKQQEDIIELEEDEIKSRNQNKVKMETMELDHQSSIKQSKIVNQVEMKTEESNLTEKEVKIQKEKSEDKQEEVRKQVGEGEEVDSDNEGIFDYYDILGLEKTDDIEAITNQYKKEIILAGFSRNTEDGKLRIKELTEAYLVLSNKQTKTQYDLTIEMKDLSLVDLWKPKEYNEDDIFSEVFEEAIKKELFKPEYYFTPMSYVAGAVIGFILFSWPGLIIIAYFCGKVGHWEDNRCPTAKELFLKLSDNQRNALLHALSRYLPIKEREAS